MKVILLAAGSQHNASSTPWVLQKLGDRAMIDYVVALARLFVDPTDLVVVVRSCDDAVAHHLGQAFHYEEQADLRGTGHAVLQAKRALGDYDGPVLILYGDTALLSEASLLGLVTRHRLKGAGLSLLTAQSDQPLPYGRIVRDAAGRLIEVVEEEEATASERQIKELNVGAYVVETAALWPALYRVSSQGDGPLPFTACVRQILRAGHTVTNYQILDEDELLGINSQENLDQATFILQKRQLQPRREEEHNLIRFGTGGWRALIGEGFTLDNVRRLCQALANDIIRAAQEPASVIIGYDRRFLSDSAAEVAAEVFAGNNIPVKLQQGDTPTPLITYATAKEQAAYGLMFTASHNPSQWNGLKVFATDGSLPLDEQTKAIENEANALSPGQVVKVDLAIARRNGIVRDVDYTNAYVDAVEALIDLQVIREAGLRVVLDAMHGVGQVTLGIILTEARCRVDTIHARHDPLFGGRNPAPDPKELAQLISLVQEGHYHLGLAMDGDADRIAIIDNTGAYVTTNELLLLVYYYLHEVRGERGGITRNLATTHLLDRLAAHLGEPFYEVPVGFKHIAASMKAHNVLLAGESSGGLTIRGHILGKDGIFACALVVEMIARTGRTVAAMLQEIYGKIGQLVSREINLPATPDMKLLVPRKLATLPLDTIAGYPVQRVSYQDGIKFYLENDNWLLLRFSGTEPLLRIFTEADTPAKAAELIDWAQQLIAV
ncbi:MAG: NTP transferase domain-containing protein [Caldilineaceae bacterium]|nr:NTP transferase domain-containing protein [Caldilineaceae bacterium]